MTRAAPGLARRPPSKQSYLAAPLSRLGQDVLASKRANVSDFDVRVAHEPSPVGLEATTVRLKALDRARIDVGGVDTVPACGLKTQVESA